MKKWQRSEFRCFWGARNPGKLLTFCCEVTSDSRNQISFLAEWTAEYFHKDRVSAPWWKNGLLLMNKILKQHIMQCHLRPYVILCDSLRTDIIPSSPKAGFLRLHSFEICKGYSCRGHAYSVQRKWLFALFSCSHVHTRIQIYCPVLRVFYCSKLFLFTRAQTCLSSGLGTVQDANWISHFEVICNWWCSSTWDYGVQAEWCRCWDCYKRNRWSSWRKGGGADWPWQRK